MHLITKTSIIIIQKQIVTRTTCMADIITIVANTKNAVHKLNLGLRPELIDSPVSVSMFGSMIQDKGYSLNMKSSCS